MGQFAVLAVIAALVLGGTVLYNAQRSAQDADDELDDYHGDRLSREAALVGLKRMERRLAANLDEWEDTESADATTRNDALALFNLPETAAGPGSFETTFDDYQAGGASTSDLAFVTAVGRFEGERFVVRAVYEKGLTDVGTPPQMRQAIVSDNRLYINGNVQISGSIHTNDELDSSGNSFDVNGTGTYVGGEGANDARFTGGLVNGDSIHVPPVIIPGTFTHQTAAAATLIAQNTNIPTQAIRSNVGNFPVTGAGTSADPYILVVRGNMSLSGNVRLVGHIRIYVQGNVNVAGNTVLAPVPASTAVPNQFSTLAQTQAWAQSNLPNGSSIGIYSTGTIDLNGNCTLVAHLYANGTVDYSGGGHRILIGGITTQDELEVRGNAQIVYTDAAQSIIDPGFNQQVPEGVRLVAYREHTTR